MKIINTKLKTENMVIKKRVKEMETGLMSRFCFICKTDKAFLRIKKDNEIIGVVSSGEYFSSYISASEGLEKTDSKGTWEFIVYLLESCEETEVEVYFCNEKLPNNIYYGDLHSHSICSGDAVNTFDEIENRIVSIGNDFHAITDHNSYAMNFQMNRGKSDIEYIYGVEMTNRFGHYNFLGKEVPVEECSVENEKELIDKMLHIKENGGYVTFNHPFSPKSRICTIPIIQEYCDFVEIWNGPWATHNKIALHWWHNKLLENIWFPICGGSDTHNINDDRNYGNPVNCIIAPYNEQKVLLSQLKKGHSYILGEPKIIEVDFYDVIFGEETENDIFKIKLKAEKNYEVKVISNIDTKEYFIKDMPYEFEIKNVNFIRFEAYDGSECVLISNPIFNKRFKRKMEVK